MSGFAAILGGGPPGDLIAALTTSGNPTSASDQFSNAGVRTAGDTVGGSFNENWVTPATSGVAANYEMKVDVTSGSFSTGTTGTWLAMTSTRTWTKSVAGTVNYDVSFRQINGPTLKTLSTSMTVT